MRNKWELGSKGEITEKVYDKKWEITEKWEIIKKQLGNSRKFYELETVHTSICIFIISSLRHESVHNETII